MKKKIKETLETGFMASTGNKLQNWWQGENISLYDLENIWFLKNSELTAANIQLNATAYIPTVAQKKLYPSINTLDQATVPTFTASACSNYILQVWNTTDVSSNKHSRQLRHSPVH